MRKLFILLITCFCFVSAQAAYLRNIPMTVTQPDGTVLHCFASGDEYFNYLHDEDGYTIIQHPQTGYYVYAEKRDGKLVATDIIAGRQNPASKGLKPYALISPEEWMARRKAWEVPDKRPINRDANHGTLNNIGIFIRFSDDPELTNSYTAIDNMFNDVSDGAVSLRSYFRAASYGNIEIPTTFYPGHDGDIVISYQDTQPRSYFEPYSSTNTNGYSGDDDRTEREHALLERAVNYINENYPIPTSLNIDYDNDGYVDNVCFIVKGGVGAWSSLLWPHMWSLYTRSVYINGKRVGTFNFQLADATGYFNTSTMCHEMNHSLGAPDLYHYYNGTSLSPAGSWDLMENNATPPQHCGAYMKMKYGHWVDDIPEITQPGVYTLNPISSDTPDNIAYKIASSNPNQFYVLEYRDKTSLFETALPGSGLLIYRIDTRFGGNASYDPDNGIYDEVYIFRPGGTTSANGNLSKAHFSSNTGRTEFSASTNPYPFLTDGTIDSEFRIYDITAAGSTISFTYGGASTLCDPPTNVAATVNDGIVYLSWNATDHAQSYNVYRNGELIGNATGTTYTDNSVSMGAYSYYVKSVDIEGLQSGPSETVTVSILPEGYIYIGDGSSTNDENLPSHSYYRYSLTQQIYTSEELGWGGTINGIAFYNEGDTKTRTLDLYLMNTKRNTFSSSNDWETVTDSYKVFSGSVTMAAHEWTNITFDTPFVYDGTSNVILVTDDNTGSWTNSPHMSCRVFSASNKAIYLYSDGIDYDPSDPSSYSGYVYSKKNQIFLQKDDDLPSYTVSVSADPLDGGTISGGGTYSQGDLCTVVATPNEGYLFKYWTIDNLMVSSDASYTFTVTEDITLVANFNTNSYQVTATPIPVEGGTVAFGSKSGSNELVYDFEDDTSQGWTLLKGPNGDSPDNWMHCVDYTDEDFTTGYGHNSSNGFMLSESYISNTDTGVTPDNYLVSPKIWLSGSITFWVTNLSNEYGAEHFGVAVSTSGNTNTNDFTTVQEWTLPIKKTGGTRTLENGIWSEYSVDLSDYQSYGYIAIRHFNCYYQWLLCVDDITLTVDDGSATATYIYGTSCTVTATPNEGYYFENWTKNGHVVSTDASYTFTVTEAVTLNANFSPNCYQVTATPIPVNGGTVAFDGKNSRNELVYDFEDGTSQGWTLLKGPNGDSPDNWMHCVDYTTENFIGKGHNSSNGFMLSESYISNTDIGVTPDNYLVSPKIWLSGSITFWVTNLSNEFGAEHFGVAVSTSGNTNANDFTTVQEWTLPIKKTGGTRTLENGIWNEYSVDLSDYQSYGYIAIRHFDCNYQWLLCVDDITITVDDGSATATYIYGTSCTVTAAPYEGYTFVNWTENGVEVSTDATYTFEVTANHDLVANFEESMTTQTTELAVGLNWWTANVGTTLADLEAALGENGLMITAPNGHTVTYDPQWGWGGNLKSLEVGKMYKIKTSAACEIELTGVAVDPTEVEITLNHGINWIGFMGSTSVALTDALSNLTPTVGDAISGGGNKYATYTEYGWGGNLKKLVPGAGYIYNSKAEGSVTFTYSVSKAYEGEDGGMDGESHWTAPTPSLYANRNLMTYRVNIDGEEQTSDDIEVAAFIGDEVRGRVRLIDGKTYLAVFGNAEDVGQTVTFKAYDHATGTEYDVCGQSMPFSGEEEMLYEGGNPLCFSQNGYDNIEEVFAYQNGSDVVVHGEGLLQIFDMTGRVVAIREIHGMETMCTSSLQAGVYILRMVGETVKTQRIVVR